MRNDMKDVITDRPHGKGWKASKGDRLKSKLQRDPEVISNKQSMGRGHGLKCKFPHSNLKPLKRFLLKSVGQRWDDVFSELCQSMDADNLRRWAKDLVETNIRLIDGAPYYTPAYWGSRYKDDAVDGWLPYMQDARSSRNDVKLYVCPETRMVKRAPDYKPKKREPQDKGIKLDDIHYAIMLKGQWFEVEVAWAPFDRYSDYARYRDCNLYDVVFNRRIFDCEWERRRLYFDGIMSGFDVLLGKDLYAIKKRQMSKKEIRKLKDLGKIKDE